MLSIIHIAGAAITTTVLSVVYLFFYKWIQRLQSKECKQSIAISFGIPEHELDNDENIERIFEFFTKRFSNEKICNRLSDLVFFICFAWNILGSIVQIAFFIFIIWSAIIESHFYAEIAWISPVISVFFFICYTAAVFTSKILTGRFPGEARLGRKNLINFINTKQINDH